MPKKQTPTAPQVPALGAEGAEALVALTHLNRALEGLYAQRDALIARLAELEDHRATIASQEQEAQAAVTTHQHHLHALHQAIAEGRAMVAATSEALADVASFPPELQPAAAGELQRRAAEWAGIVQEEEAAITADEAILADLLAAVEPFATERARVEQEIDQVEKERDDLIRQITFLEQRRVDLHHQQGAHRYQELEAELMALQALATKAAEAAQEYAERMVHELAAWPDLAVQARRHYAPNGWDRDGFYWQQVGNTRVLRTR